MNNFIEFAYQGKQLIVKGKSVAKRQFIYVDDLAETFVCVQSSERESIIFECWYAEAYTNLSIANTVNSVFENTNSIDYQEDIDENIDSLLWILIAMLVFRL